jgi:mannose-6-phosphate isomerase-like protein (cupin superfamily)
MSVVWPGDGAQVRALGSTYTAKVDGEGTRGAYALVEEDFWGDPTPLHSHTDAEEAFYVLSGRPAVWLDGEELVAEPGTFLLVPRGAPHALRRLTDEPVRMLTLVSPPGFERFFDAVLEQGEDALLADPERLVALARAYGTEILGDHPGT